MMKTGIVQLFQLLALLLARLTRKESQKEENEGCDKQYSLAIPIEIRWVGCREEVKREVYERKNKNDRRGRSIFIPVSFSHYELRTRHVSCNLHNMSWIIQVGSESI